MNIQDRVINWVKENKGTFEQPIEVSNDTDLLRDGLLDSLDFLQLVTFIEDEFKLVVPVEDLTPENFSTPDSVSVLVGRLIAFVN